MMVLVLSLAGLAVILAGGICYACLLMASASAQAEALAAEALACEAEYQKWRQAGTNGRVEEDKENVHV